MFRTLIAIALFLHTVSLSSQITKDSLYVHTYNFHIVSGFLPDTISLELDQLDGYFWLLEMTDSSNAGCFMIYTAEYKLQSNAQVAYIVVENDSITIYHYKSGPLLVERIIDHPAIEEATKLELIRRIIRYYNRPPHQFDFGTAFRRFGPHVYQFSDIDKRRERMQPGFLYRRQQ